MASHGKRGRQFPCELITVKCAICASHHCTVTCYIPNIQSLHINYPAVSIAQCLSPYLQSSPCTHQFSFVLFSKYPLFCIFPSFSPISESICSFSPFPFQTFSVSAPSTLFPEHPNK